MGTLKVNGAINATGLITADFFKGSLKSLSTVNTTEELDAFIPNSGLGYICLEDEAAAVFGKTDGVVISMGFGTSYGAQMYFDDGSGEGGMMIRNRSSSTTWHPWRQVLTDSNYTSYTVTKTGSGASGTWSINITGNAATATKFASAQSINLTGDTTGSASSQAGWSLSTITKKISYDTQLTTDSAINNFNAANKLQMTTWNSTSSPGVSNGIIINGGWTSTDYGFQLAIDDDPTWYIALRQKSTSGWNAWKRIPMGDGTGASGTWGINITGASTHLSRIDYYSTTADLDAFIGNKLQYCTVTADAVSAIGNDGNVLSIGSSTSWGTQIWFDDGASHGGMALRCRSSSGWNAWHKILDDYNYTSYVYSKSDSDNRYVNIGGDTMSGKLQVNAPIFGYNYSNNTNAAAFIFDKPGSHYTGIGSGGNSNIIHFGPCNADGTWVSNYNQIWRFQGCIYASGWLEADNYGSSEPGTSTPGYGRGGAIYFKV